MEHKFTYPAAKALFDSSVKGIHGSTYGELEGSISNMWAVLNDPGSTEVQREAAKFLKVEAVSRQNQMAPSSADPMNWNEGQQLAATNAMLKEAETGLASNPESDYWKELTHGLKNVLGQQKGEPFEPYFASPEDKEKFEARQAKHHVTYIKPDE